MCNTCGDVWHVVVAKEGEKITKVECKQCGKQHRFKPTGEAPDANLQPKRTRTVVAAPAVAGSPRKTRTRRDVGLILDPDQPKRRYSISESFAEGQQIEHPKFGIGVVCAVEDTKIRVNFADGTKTLLHRSAKS
jgi:hypothetical protein